MQRFRPDSFYADIQIDYRGYKNRKLTVGGKDLINGNDFFYGAHLNLGYAFTAGDSFAITPFIGVGSSSSKLDVDGMAFGFGGGYLVRKSEYGALGLRFDGNLSSRWDLGLMLQVSKPLSDPTVTSNITSVGAGMTQDLKWKFKKKYNYKVELPVTYKLSNSNSSLRLTPYYETQRYGNVNSGPGIGGQQQMKMLFQVIFGELEYLIFLVSSLFTKLP